MFPHRYFGHPVWLYPFPAHPTLRTTSKERWSVSRVLASTVYSHHPPLPNTSLACEYLGTSLGSKLQKWAGVTLTRSWVVKASSGEINHKHNFIPKSCSWLTCQMRFGVPLLKGDVLVCFYSLCLSMCKYLKFANFIANWTCNEILRVGIPTLYVLSLPHGLEKGFLLVAYFYF